MGGGEEAGSPATGSQLRKFEKHWYKMGITKGRITENGYSGTSRVCCIPAAAANIRQIGSADACEGEMLLKHSKDPTYCNN